MGVELENFRKIEWKILTNFEKSVNSYNETNLYEIAN